METLVGTSLPGACGGTGTPNACAYACTTRAPAADVVGTSITLPNDGS